MSRIKTLPGDTAPDIDSKAVAAFFNDRARRLEEVGPVKAVIYQDKHGDLAEHRDAAEVTCIQPLLKLDGSQRLLDVGCGTGRWSRRLIPQVKRYHGIDANDALLNYARMQYSADKHSRFTCLSADRLSQEALGEGEFNRILCAGICIYLNDQQLSAMFTGIVSLSAPKALIMLREPMAVAERLTLREHYSDELEHDYNAIYRNESEFLAIMESSLMKAGFSVVGRGDVYEDKLNNRAETRQRWLLLERQ